MYWEQQAGDRDWDADRMAAERDQAIVERDDHAARSLPHLDTPDWPETDQRVDALHRRRARRPVRRVVGVT
jgi:hypothetical protein